MADEITLSAIFKAANSSTSILERVTDLSVDMTGTHIIHNRQEIGTVEEVLLLGDVGVGGWFFGINRDATSTISIRPATGETDLVKMLAGEFALFRVHADAATPYVIGGSAGVELEYWLLEL